MERRMLWVTLLLLLPAIRGAAAQCIPPVLAFSTSAEDPWAQALQPFQGTRDIYVWFANYDWDELVFGIDGTLDVVATTAMDGFTDVGSTREPHLVADAGCIGGIYDLRPVLAITLSDPSATGGEICPTEAAGSSRLCFRLCPARSGRTPGSTD